MVVLSDFDFRILSALSDIYILSSVGFRKSLVTQTSCLASSQESRCLYSITGIRVKKQNKVPMI